MVVMRITGRAFFTTLGAALVAAAGVMAPAGAHDGHDHGGAQHGGVEAKTKRHHFEAVFTKAGVTLYVHGAEHKPVELAGLSASATFYHPNAPEKPWFSRELKAKPASPGQAAHSLAAAVDLSKAPEKGARVAFRVTGLADPAEPDASFTVPFSLAGGGELSVTKATAVDQEAIDALKLCPVSHEELGSMGTPLKVSLNGRATYLCCKGCLKGLRANPDKFLGSSASATEGDSGHDHHDHSGEGLR